MELYNEKKRPKSYTNNVQLSYKHWGSCKNCRTLDFKCISAENEDFDEKEHYILSFTTCIDM